MTAYPARRRARPRTPLNREKVLRAAIAMADRSGIGTLSMRNLASRVGVEAMSLYNHVRNKEDMLDGMVDVVFRQIDLPASGTAWRQAMRQRAISARQVLLRHPWAVALMESRSQPGPASLRHHDAVLGSLRTAGFTIQQAGHAYSVLDSYVYGFTLTELALPLADSRSVAQVAETILKNNQASQFAYLAEMTRLYAGNTGYKYADEFEFGLDLVLGGIQRMRRH